MEKTAQKTFVATMLCIPPNASSHQQFQISNVDVSSEQHNIQRTIAMSTQTHDAEIQVCSVRKESCTDWTRLTPLLNLRGIARPNLHIM